METIKHNGMINNAYPILLSLIIITFALPSSHGALITYTNRATWEAAITGTIATQDFESFGADTFLSNGLALGDGIVASEITGVAPFAMIDVPPQSTGGQFSPNTTSYLLGIDNLAVTTRFNFSQSLLGWGGDFGALNPQFGTFVEVYDSNLTLVGTDDFGGGNTFSGFWGFTFDAGETAGRLDFRSSAFGDGWGLDDMSYSTTSTVVPEPSTYILGILGLITFSFLKKRKSK